MGEDYRRETTREEQRHLLNLLKQEEIVLPHQEDVMNVLEEDFMASPSRISPQRVSHLPSDSSFSPPLSSFSIVQAVPAPLEYFQLIKEQTFHTSPSVNPTMDSRASSPTLTFYQNEDNDDFIPSRKGPLHSKFIERD